MALRKLLGSVASSSSTLARISATKIIPTSSSPSPSPLFASLGSFRSINLDIPPIFDRAEDPPNTKIFITGLIKNTTDDGLKKKFSEFGQLVESRIIIDRVSGRSRDFAFVRYTTLEEAIKAKEATYGIFLDGWVIFVDYAKPKVPKPPAPAEEPNPCGLNIQKIVGCIWRWHGYSKHRNKRHYFDSKCRADHGTNSILNLLLLVGTFRFLKTRMLGRLLKTILTGGSDRTRLT